MDDEKFDELVESVREGGEILRGKPRPPKEGLPPVPSDLKIYEYVDRIDVQNLDTFAQVLRGLLRTTPAGDPVEVNWDTLARIESVLSMMSIRLWSLLEEVGQQDEAVD